MSEIKSITQQIEDICGEICDNYCKYPELSLEKYKDPDEAYEWLMNHCCEKCPLMRLN